MPARGMAENPMCVPAHPECCNVEVGGFATHGVEINYYTMRSHRGPGDQPVLMVVGVSPICKAPPRGFCCFATNQIGSVALMSLTPIDALSRGLRTAHGA
jgi:hypothetical protein